MQDPPKENDQTTDFGFKKIPVSEKMDRVKGVFTSVAGRYDVMNDLMSLGIHRVWKRVALRACRVRPGHRVLDLASGTGDLAAKLSPLVGVGGKVVLADINPHMLGVARGRLLDQGLRDNLAFVEADAEALPFPPNHFDRVIIGFGLRNVTNKSRALAEMYRVLKPGGHALVLEFSKVTWPVLDKLYDAYSFHLLPKLGQWVAKDEASYRYLAESIRMHPDQHTLQGMMEKVGFEECGHENLTGGIVALHKGYKY